MLKALLLLLGSLWIAAGVAAQAEEKPTVAMLRFGSFFSFTYVENAVIDTMFASGLITEAEHGMLMARENLEGEKLNVHWNDANFDFAAVNTIVEDALDRGRGRFDCAVNADGASRGQLNGGYGRPANRAFHSGIQPL